MRIRAFMFYVALFSVRFSMSSPLDFSLNCWILRTGKWVDSLTGHCVSLVRYFAPKVFE